MNDGQHTDIPSDDRSDNQWVSFVELATRRGISKDAAHRLVRRKGWRRQSDNRGRVLVLVPVEELAQAEVGRPANQPDNRSDSPPDNRSDNAALPAMFQVALDAKDAVLMAKDQEIAAKDSLVAELRIRLDQARAEIADAKAAVERADAAAQEAQEAAEALRRADEQRRALGRWARLRVTRTILW